MRAPPNGVLKGGWYSGPKSTLQPSVLDPIPYVVQGKQVWLATISAPIVENNKFYGVVGVDYDLEFVQKITSNLQKELYGGTSEVTIVSYHGLIVASSTHPDKVGQPLAQVVGDAAAQTTISRIQQGRAVLDKASEANEFQRFLLKEAKEDVV